MGPSARRCIDDCPQKLSLHSDDRRRGGPCTPVAPRTDSVRDGPRERIERPRANSSDGADASLLRREPWAARSPCSVLCAGNEQDPLLHARRGHDRDADPESNHPGSASRERVSPTGRIRSPMDRQARFRRSQRERANRRRKEDGCRRELFQRAPRTLEDGPRYLWIDSLFRSLARDRPRLLRHPGPLEVQLSNPARSRRRPDRSRLPGRHWSSLERSGRARGRDARRQFEGREAFRLSGSPGASGRNRRRLSAATRGGGAASRLRVRARFLRSKPAFDPRPRDSRLRRLHRRRKHRYRSGLRHRRRYLGRRIRHRPRGLLRIGGLSGKRRS